MSEIDPDEIFLDSSNLPDFDVHQFQGRLERPLARHTGTVLGIVFLVCALIFVGRLWKLGLTEGEAYAARSEKNRLHESDVFANRGVIFDTNRVPLAFNTTPAPDKEFSLRGYATTTGIAHVVGYLKYPVKDSSGFYFRKNFLGQDGIESVFNDTLSGTNGLKIVETNALGDIQSESTSRPPRDGSNIVLTVDSRLSDALYTYIAGTATDRGFSGGAGVLMDVTNGHIVALASYPEYDPAAVSGGDPAAFSAYQKDKRTPFLDRVVSGLYTPGSIIKPIMALAALQEKVISPDKQILSTGSISLPNPYFPDKKSVFRDWKAHGWVDMRRALAVSSDVYFYEIGGGFQDQKGLGVERIEKYLRMFGLGEKTGVILPNEQGGIIPNPTWKEKNFDGDPWRVGDTYNLSIGQYGLQVTPLQVVRYIAAIANRGTLFTPAIVSSDESAGSSIHLPINPEYYDIVHQGMRAAVTDGGTAAGLNTPVVEVAGKTGTAELGALKQYVNSWSVGFFPYKKPHYAFAVIMERGSHTNTIGATYVMRQMLDWMGGHTPEYLSIDQ